MSSRSSSILDHFLNIGQNHKDFFLSINRSIFPVYTSFSFLLDIKVSILVCCLVLEARLTHRDMIQVEAEVKIEFHPGPFPRSLTKSYRLISIEDTIYIHWTYFITILFYMVVSIYVCWWFLESRLSHRDMIQVEAEVKIEFHPGPFPRSLTKSFRLISIEDTIYIHWT